MKIFWPSLTISLNILKSAVYGTIWYCNFPAGADGSLSLGAAVCVGRARSALQAGVLKAPVERVAEPPGRALADRPVT